jgi:hypothetical protein
VNPPSTIPSMTQWNPKIWFPPIPTKYFQPKSS